MHTFTLSTNIEKSCTVHIGLGTLRRAASLFELREYSRVFILTDQLIAPFLLNKLLATLPEDTTSCIIAASEKQKQIDTIEQIWNAMHDAGCDRKSLMINLGGGVIMDVGGFAAATYMRGIDFINIPTTLLAQVDASVGGKNGFNFSGIKNLIGSFVQPIGVVIDPEVLNTLPQREFTAGFAEIIKHGLIRDKKYFDLVTAKLPLAYEPSELSDVIAGSCRIKMTIIQEDILEQGNRKIVNFGHTVGHAVESLSLKTDRPLLHGEAISIGMLTEARLSQELGLLQAKEVELIETVLRKAGLPVIIPDPDIDKLIKIMQSDKKSEKQQLNFTLLDRLGHAQINQHVPISVLKSVLKHSGVARA